MTYIPPQKLMLASASRYRRALLARLRIPFSWQAPAVDESRRPNELPEDMVRRLAFTKAQAIADHHPDALVIGSDQVALIGSEIVGKPGDYDSAFAQLQRASAANISFLTGICVLASGTQGSLIDCIAAGVTIRRLDAVTIERYLRLEQPYDCAGSIKCEGLGITLIEKFVGDDPTALIGLPLIRLTTMLQRFGYNVLAAGASVTEAVRAPPD